MSRPTCSLGPFLEKEKLKTGGSNFNTWFRTLRILLVPQKMIYVLEAPLGVEPEAIASQDDKNVYQSRVDDFSIVQSGMLYAMEPELQKHFENMSAFEIIKDLKAVFALRLGRRGMRLPSSSSPPRCRNTVVLVSSWSRCLATFKA